jgi:hypothetical protein
MPIEAEMSNAAIRPPAPRGERPLPESVRAFLLESERRVLSHCRKLLTQDNLPPDERQRLLRLATEAEDEIQRLDGWAAIEAA